MKDNADFSNFKVQEEGVEVEEEFVKLRTFKNIKITLLKTNLEIGMS